MMHDSDQPLSVIYTAVEPTSLVDQSPVPGWQEVAWEGRQVMLRADVNGRPIVDRLVSTNLDDYLNPQLQPGVQWPPPFNTM